MQCSRCKGYMILEKFLDLNDDTGKLSFRGWRCLICGEVYDPVIQEHRKRVIPRTVKVPKKRKFAIGVN